MAWRRTTRPTGRVPAEGTGDSENTLRFTSAACAQAFRTTDVPGQHLTWQRQLITFARILTRSHQQPALSTPVLYETSVSCLRERRSISDLTVKSWQTVLGPDGKVIMQEARADEHADTTQRNAKQTVTDLTGLTVVARRASILTGRAVGREEKK